MSDIFRSTSLLLENSVCDDVPPAICCKGKLREKGPNEEEEKGMSYQDFMPGQGDESFELSISLIPVKQDVKFSFNTGHGKKVISKMSIIPVGRIAPILEKGFSGSLQA